MLVPRPVLSARSSMHLSAARKLVVFWLAFIAALGSTPAQDSGDLRYLLVRRAGAPEKNYYEFTRRLVGILDSDLEFHGVLDVRTEDPASTRYGVYRIYRSRVLRETDSEKQPASTAEGTFVLTYHRDPNLKFRAKSYRFDFDLVSRRPIETTALNGTLPIP